MTVNQMKTLQRAMNAFTRKRLLGIQPLHVDGRFGPATRARVRTIKYQLGYLGPINSIPDKAFRERLWHPNSTKYSTLQRIRRGQKRRTEQRRNYRKNAAQAHKTSGVGTFDGIPVANAAIAYLTWARSHGWNGRLVSGYRTPAYSESLCYRMCGRPQCPGRCAGKATNHAYAEPNRFACDVSNYWLFGRVIAGCPIRPKIFNALGARDPVHFSPSGN